MQISKTENVIYLKEAESNMIDQAFIILKDNVKVNFLNINECEKYKDKMNIIKDVENLINYEIEKNNVEIEKFKCKVLNKKIKILKTINIITVILFILSILVR